MINFDHRGITRTAHALADIGECFLRLTLDHPAPLATLDAALPDDPETPANGGWFEAPGGWYLRLEGMFDVDQWAADVAARLEELGVSGRLTGTLPARFPAWGSTVELLPMLAGCSTYPPLGLGPDTSRSVMEHAVAWLQEPVVYLHTGTTLKVPAATAAAYLSKKLLANAPGAAQSYREGPKEIRTVALGADSYLSLQSRAAGEPSIREFISKLLTAPRTGLLQSRLSHHDWGAMFASSNPGDGYYCGVAFKYRPWLREEFTIDPCGFQILTQRHLERTHDLTTNWDVTPLGEGYYSVQARDLDAWYPPEPIGARKGVPAILEQGRRDFGDMILTTEYANEHGINNRWLPPGHPHYRGDA